MNRLCSTLTALVLAVAVATPGLGQNAVVGVKAGVDFADLGGDFEDILSEDSPTRISSDLKTGFSVGGFLGVDVHRLFRLQGEVQFVQKGAKATAEGAEGIFKLTYIEVIVPLTLLIPVEGAGVQPRLYAGPAIAFELGCDVEIKEPGETREFECENAPPKRTSKLRPRASTGGFSLAAASTYWLVRELSASTSCTTWDWQTSRI